LASSDRSTPIPYQPANPPYTEKLADFSRSTWDEFYRIAERFLSIDRPAAMAVTEQKSVPIQPAEVWTRLFNTGLAYDWEQPAGQLAAGVWTCPQEGLYDVSVVIEVPAFPQPGSRIYEATLRTTWRPAAGGADRVTLSKTGGPDEVALRLVAEFLRPLNRGDQVWFDLDLTEQTYTGNLSVLSILNVCRQASVK
jgi:hypothetical protein